MSDWDQVPQRRHLSFKPEYCIYWLYLASNMYLHIEAQHSQSTVGSVAFCRAKFLPLIVAFVCFYPVTQLNSIFVLCVLYVSVCRFSMREEENLLTAELNPHKVLLNGEHRAETNKHTHSNPQKYTLGNWHSKDV